MGEQELQQMKIEYYVEFGERSSHIGKEVDLVECYREV